MIHVLDFNDNIIDYISDKNNFITSTTLTRSKEESTDTYDFVIDSDRAENLRERNRIITQDRNGVYREYIIVNVEDDIDDQTTVQCNASYVEDLTTAKPYAPGSFTKFTTTQALDDITKDTGWERAEDTEYGGVRSSSWTSYQTRYAVLQQMCTTYDMELDFYIELSSNTVAHRYVSLKSKKSLFKGKEIKFGKDLLTMTRTVDITEIHTALLAVGPEDDAGNRKEVIVTDDDVQEQFGLDKRYIWGIYEPESDDSAMTEARLTTLARTQLNKDKQAAVSYEITSTDISKSFPHEIINFGDTVRIKDLEFNPPLYVEAEVIGEVYDAIANESTFTFGNVKEFKESELRKDLYERLASIQQKMNDNITNVNTIVEDVVAGQLEYFERKIIKSDTPPENPVNDMFWYDTSNPEVAVLRRYWNGEWVEETASDVEQIGGITREKALFSELTNTFINLTIQHARLQSDVYEIVSSEYLVDDDLRAKVNGEFNKTATTYNKIKTNLDSMLPETATIGKLVDTQYLFLNYREQLQVLYNAIENAKRAIDKRFKLLQSQYTDEKFNTAMETIAATLPNGQWDSETNQLLGDIPSREELENLQSTVVQYLNKEIGSLSEALKEETDYKINVAKDELSAGINGIKEEINGLEFGGVNLLRSYTQDFHQIISSSIIDTKEFDFTGWGMNLYEDVYINQKLVPNETYTISYDMEVVSLSNKQVAATGCGIILFDRNTQDYAMRSRKNMPREVGYIEHVKETFVMKQGEYDLIGYSNLLSENGETTTKPLEYDTIKIKNLQLEKGTVETDFSHAPEDNEYKITLAQQQATEAAQAYADAQDELKRIETQAYADEIVTSEEKRAIKDATDKLNAAKLYAKEQATIAQNIVLSESERLSNEAKQAAQDYATAQDELKQTETQAYTDGVVDIVEKKAIQDATDKMNTAKTYAETKAAEAQAAAKADAEEKLKPITTRITTTESNIKILQDGLKLTATKTDVQQTLNEKLEPIKNQVNEQKATLDVLPNQIASKVSQSDYDTDQNNIVSRLNSADTERVQLSNSISDRVTIKEYTDSKAETTEEIKNAVDNIQVGGRNLFRSYDESLKNTVNETVISTQSFTGQYWAANLYTADYLKNVLVEGEEYTYSYELEIIGITENVLPNSRSHGIIFYSNSIIDDRITSSYKSMEQIVGNKLKISQTFIAPKITDHRFVIYSGLYTPDGTLNTERYSNTIEMKNLKLEKGNKATDWTPAPEDIQAQVVKAQADAETAAKAYADAQDNLRKTEAQAYADGIVSEEEQRAINDATAKLNTAKTYAEQKATTAQTAAQSYAKTQSTNALTQANAYTDSLKATTEQKLTTMNTTIEQNGKDIALKATTTEMNASKKTLSEVIAAITVNTTNGITLSYDENGSISTSVVDKNGVSLRGDKVDITVNKDFNVVAKAVDTKVGKTEIINRLNVSPEGLDINVNKVGIRGGDATNYISIKNNGILSYGEFERSWAGSKDTAKLELGINDGRVLVRNQKTGYRLYFTERGLSTMMDGFSEDTSGTLEFHSQRFNETSRGITMHSTYGAVALLSEQSRIYSRSNLTNNVESFSYGVYIRPFMSTRPGLNEFNFYVKDNDGAGNTDGAILFGEVSDDRGLAGSGIRFKKNGVRGYDDMESIVYATDNAGNIGSGSFYSYKMYGDWRTKNTNLYAEVGGELRVTDMKGYNGGKPTYSDLKVSKISTQHSYAFANNSGSDVYFGVGYNELRITANNWWNGGKPAYQDIRFKNWFSTSSEKFKYDIHKWDYEVLEVLKNDLQLYTFKRDEEADSDYVRNHHGVVIERETPIEWVHKDGVDNYEMNTWTLKGVQELALLADKQKNQIDVQQQQLDEQNERIERLEKLLLKEVE